MSDTYLEMSWGTSRGLDTYGYNICRLVDTSTGKRYRCMGGGYDMQGTVFAEWLEGNYADELLAIKDKAHSITRQVALGEPRERTTNDGGLYGMTWTTLHIEAGAGEYVRLNGACGLDSIERIAQALGLKIRHLVGRRGHLNGMIVTDNAR